MIKILKNTFPFLMALSVLFWCGCATDYEIEKEAHVWRFYGLENDTTAIVKVTLEQWGTTHDHHIMGWDDDFHKTIDLKYYTTSMNSYKISVRNNESKGALEELDSTDQYRLRIEKEDDYSTVCAIILQDNKKKNLDTLEIDHCPRENSAESPKFVGSYLKIDNCFYKIEKNKFHSQKPTYKFQHVDYNIKFTRADGSYIIYGGEP
ncbi:hypothetical protein [Fibrobacter sp. UWB12]|uniref:hypothetical protein n=1 Tax=Fibrobacter sp. UWB12 TaxID=1896203 RepID=UPI000918095F|nr:hypothetical protein [Fibrobacter sp. UWB12]SHK70003.1 hypothetical protein SAMN05720759_105204 [Fibrobacter sp. UWB12]